MSEGELFGPSGERVRDEKLKEERTEERLRLAVVTKGKGRTQGENAASAPRATLYFIVAFADANRSVRRGETRRGMPTTGISARKEKSATHDDTRRANTREATRRV